MKLLSNKLFFVFQIGLLASVFLLLTMNRSQAQCSGTPAGGTAITSVTSMCIGNSTNLSLTGASSGSGISYQWQAKLNAGAYADIPGATTVPYAHTPAAAGTYTFQCKVICSNGGGQSMSAPSANLTVNVAVVPSIVTNGPTTFCSGGNVGLSSSSTNTLGNAISFNYQYLDLSGWSDIVSIYQGAFTIETWLSPNSASGQQALFHNGCQTGAFYSCSVTCPSLGLSIGGISTCNTSAVSGHYNFIFRTTTNNYNLASVAPVVAGQWTHVAISYDGSSQLKMYINGVLDNSITVTGSCLNNGYYFQVASMHQQVYYYSCDEEYQYVGKMDEFRMWKVERSASQISANLYKTVTTNPTEMAVYYRFDNTLGSPQDFSGHGYAGFLTNATTYESPSTSPVNSYSSYSWQPNGQTSPGISTGTSGMYSLTVTDANGCTASASQVVTSNPLPAVPTITPNGPTSFCEGDSVLLTSSSATGNVWSTGASTQSIWVKTSGTYKVTVTNGFGCTAVSSNTLITVNQRPTLFAIPGNNQSFCQGNSMQLYQQYSAGVLWSTGATTQAINVNTSGNYTVTVTTAAGCTRSNTWTITVNPIPPTPVVTASGPTTFCLGDSVVFTSSASTDNEWNTGQRTQSVVFKYPNPVRVYVVINGCSSAGSNTFMVEVHGIAPSVHNVDACVGIPVQLGALPQGSILNLPNPYSGPDTTYIATYTDQYGCTVTNSATIVHHPVPTSVNAGNDVTICQGASTTLTPSGMPFYSWNTFTTPVRPLDAISGATMAVGLRRLNSGYSGPCIQLVKWNYAWQDYEVKNFGFAGDFLDVNAIESWRDGQDLACSALFDQSGNGNHMYQEDDVFHCPIFKLGPDGKPLLYFYYAGVSLSNPISVQAPYSLVYRGQVQGSFTGQVVGGINNSWSLGFVNGYRSQAYFNGDVSNGNTTPADMNYYVYGASGNGSSSQVYENGNLIYNNSNGIATPDGVIVIGTSPGFNFTELILFNNILSPANMTTLYNSMNEYNHSPQLTVAPATTTTYTVTGYESTYGCPVTDNVTVTVHPCDLSINLKVLIEGYYTNSGLMNPLLNLAGLSTDPTACDSVEVELHNINAPYSLLAKGKGLLHTNGNATIQFPSFPMGRYYLSIRHHNSVEVWTKNPVNFSSQLISYDISSGLSQAYDDGYNPPMKLMAPGKYALYSGDINQDGGIDGNDMNYIDNEQVLGNFGYLLPDLNGDGGVDGNDMNFVDNNQTLGLYFARPY